ncbi:3-hydroxyacyl-CoA dehydrogenase family protein [Sphingomonas oligophenolica]|uniref:3-hydroxyacyl-CoA dehydrogenase family protein n=2 Tax=Sphingomonas oligophenolica TaxID=301154 RepID=A0ABU9YB43_9SPHN
MGAGIAALFANAGLCVALLDIDPALSAAAVSRQIKAGGFTDPAFADRIRTGSSITDLDMVADADWIVEAAAESLDTKHQIFTALNAVRKRGSIVSSNTSTIRLSQLVGGMDPLDARDYLIAHFFNPPRTMKLLELVAGPQTRLEATALVTAFSEESLGRCVVPCRDTPGFIANRIGNFWTAVALDAAIAQNLDVEEADALIGYAFGSAAGIFGLLDLVGIDLVPTASRSLRSALADDDPLQAYPAEPPLITAMIAEGRVGRKAGAGFFRKDHEGTLQVLDLRDRTYRARRPASSPALAATEGDLRLLMSHESAGGRFMSVVMSRTLAYAASLIPEIADTPDHIDQAMREGYGWQQGPFQLIERLGPGWLVTRLRAEHIPVPASLEDAGSGTSVT